jgi:hypothetical protein
MLVKIYREPWIPFFELTLENGHSFEFDAEEALEWFKERGADMEKVEKAMDYAQNFYHANIEINNPKAPKPSSPLDPKV